MLLHDLLRSGKADARSGNSSRHVATAVKPLEDVRQIRGRDTQTTVLDRHHHPRSSGICFTLRASDNFASRRAVLDGVVEHVADDPLDARAISGYDQR